MPNHSFSDFFYKIEVD